MFAINFIMFNSLGFGPKGVVIINVDDQIGGRLPDYLHRGPLASLATGECRDSVPSFEVLSTENAH
jgi:hypothetical protein